jgi:hypothetical protein
VTCRDRGTSSLARSLKEYNGSATASTYRFFQERFKTST